MIKVIVSFEDALVVSTVHQVLNGQADIEIIGEARITADMLGLAQSRAPDVVLMDMPLNDADVFDVIAQLRQQPEPPNTLILSSYREPSGVAALMNAGVLGYFTRCDEPHLLPHAIRAVASGLPCCSPTMQQRLVNWIAESAKPTVNHDLSPREVEILRCLVRDQSDGQIAESLQLSKNTVQFHLKSIYAKLGVYTRVGAAVWTAKNLPPFEER
jgi:DNA-binding NarL/FixJ family response regulator